jgi:hypothetical protein
MSTPHPTSPHLSLSAAALDVFTSEGARAPTEEEERQMRDLGIRRDGPDYDYRGYRYEKWSDAVAYARMGRADAAEGDVGPPRRPRPTTALTAADHALMAALGIQFDGRAFRFGAYRYDLLADAVQFARRAGRPTSS